jgi:hypothetical protein
VVFSTNKNDRHDITEILLKVALNTIKQTNKHTHKQTNKQTNKQTSKQTNKQTNKQKTHFLNEDQLGYGTIQSKTLV